LAGNLARSRILAYAFMARGEWLESRIRDDSP